LNGFDTDSLFIDIGGFLDDKIGKDWRSLSDEKKIFYIKKLSRIIEEYVNENCYRETQRKTYNSAVQDFRIKWKQEVIAKSALFICKKRYSMYHVNEEGAPVNYIKNVGLEIVRSDTPSSIRPRLKEMVDMILKGSTDKELRDTILKHKSEISKVYPEEIAVNVGVSDIEKYQDSDGKATKGTPWHVKGVLNYRKLLEYMSVKDKYEDISSKTKVKVVYVKKNLLGIDSVSFIRWPKEFDDVVQIDYQKHIEKFYTDKILMLLEPMQKIDLLKQNSAGLDLFFQ
jgi:hypothetical protein